MFLSTVSVKLVVKMQLITLHFANYIYVSQLIPNLINPFIPTFVAKMSLPKRFAPYWFNPPFLFVFDIRALWRYALM